MPKKQQRRHVEEAPTNFAEQLLAVQRMCSGSQKLGKPNRPTLQPRTSTPQPTQPPNPPNPPKAPKPNPPSPKPQLRLGQSLRKERPVRGRLCHRGAPRGMEVLVVVHAASRKEGTPVYGTSHSLVAWESSSQMVVGFASGSSVGGERV